MSSNFFVYTDDEHKADLCTPELVEALASFLRAVMEGESAELHWSL